MATSKVVSGARLVCLINGQQYGAVVGVAYNIISQRSPEHGLDAVEAFELAPTTVSVRGTVQLLMVKENESIEGINMTAGLPYVPEEQYFTMELQDRLTGFSYIKFEYCSVEQQSWQVAAKSLAAGTVSFVGIMAKPHFVQQ